MRLPSSPSAGPGQPRHPVFDYKPPTYLGVLRYGLVTVIGVAVFAIAYSGFWFFAATRLKAGVEEWVAQRLDEGTLLTYERLEIGGFPLALRVDLTTPRAAPKRFGDTGKPNAWRIEAARASAESVPWNFRRLDLELMGDLRVQVPGTRRPVVYEGRASKLFSRLIFHDDGLPGAVSIEVAGLEMAADGRPRAIAAAEIDLQAERLFPEPVSHLTPTLSLKLDGRKLKVPDSLSFPLGHAFSELGLSANLLGPLPAKPLAEALAQWRDAGGTVEVSRLNMGYGPLDIRAVGTLALDEELQPIGALTTQIQGFFLALDALKRAGIIRSRNAAMAKVVLGVLARRPRGGGPATLSLPLTLQDRQLYTKGLTLFKLPTVDWGGGKSEKGGVKLVR